MQIARGLAVSPGMASGPGFFCQSQTVNGVCSQIDDPMLEFDELSMSPRAIPHVKEAIRRFSLTRAREIAKKALQLPTAQEVRSDLQIFSNREPRSLRSLYCNHPLEWSSYVNNESP